jgi:hypothetical protein
MLVNWRPVRFSFLNFKGTPSQEEHKTIFSSLWKEVQQEVQQHWFIDSYIAAYIQMQYRVIAVHPTGLTEARGVSRCPQGFPEPRLGW